MIYALEHGEEACINRVRESRCNTLALYQQCQDKVIVVGNETVESLRGIKQSVTALLVKLQEGLLIFSVLGFKVFF